MERNSEDGFGGKIWDLISPKEELNSALSKDLDIHPLIARILTNRGLEDPESIHNFIYPKLSDLRDPFTMKDMDKAVERTIKAISTGEKIIIYGDYDVDGITSIALLTDVFRSLNADADFYLPNRMTEGYGLSKEGIERCIAMGANLIISVDCGINSVEEADFAREKGVDIIITDHHEPDDNLPRCVALLNPKRKDGDYPFKHLAGVGVTFKFAQGLIQAAGETKLLDKNLVHIKDMLDLVALGTVADVVPLVDENRIFVKYGIKQINKTNRIGLRELKAVASVSEDVTSSDIAFKLAPRLNAVGRLGDARHAVKLLTSEDEQEAFNLAGMMEQNNRRRQTIEGEILEEAQEMIEREIDLERTKTLILHSGRWHQGVIGIVASRIAKHYSRPAFIISVENGIGKGSARSIEEFDILELLRSCHDLLDSYGGHQLAAGFQIDMSKIEEMHRRIENVASEKLGGGIFHPRLMIDAEVQLVDMTPDFIQALEMLEPFGNGNQRPVFSTRNLFLKWAPKIVGNNHLKLWFENKENVIEGIVFNKGHMISEMQDKKTPYDVAFIPKLNYYRDAQSVQLFIRDIKPSRS